MTDFLLLFGLIGGALGALASLPSLVRHRDEDSVVWTSLCAACAVMCGVYLDWWHL